MKWCFLIFTYLTIASTMFVPSRVWGVSLCDNLVGDIVLTKGDSPVSVCAYAEVPERGSLSIEPGVEVDFDSESNLTVLGILYVQGTESDPVVFRGNPKSLSVGGPATSTFLYFKNVLLEDLKPGFYIDNARVIFEGVKVRRGEGVSFNNSTVYIASSTFLSQHGDAVSFYGSVADLSNVFVEGVTHGSGISAYENSVLRLSSTTISSGDYSGLSVYDSIVTGSQNSFLSNRLVGVEVYGSSSANLFHSSMKNDLYDMVSFSDATSSVRGSWWGGRDPQVGVDYVGNVDTDPWLKFDPNSVRPDVIFFPGIQASRLFVDENGDQNQLWEPNRARDVEKLLLNDVGESIESGIYSGQVIDQINVPIKNQKIYKSFINSLSEWKESGLINNYKLEAYDWRYSLSTLAEGLVGSFNLNRPTVFIGHSNGGLLAKLIINLLPQDVRRNVALVLVASPQRGSAQALATLLHADSAAILGGLILSKKLALALISPMVSVYTLLPWNTLSPLIIFDKKIIDKQLSLSKIAWPDFLIDFPLSHLVGAKFNFDLPQIKQYIFNKAKEIQVTLKGIDEVLKPDLTIYGQGERTLGGVRYDLRESCLAGSVFAKLHLCKPSFAISYSPIYKDGDGTVEVESSWPGYPATSSDVFAVGLRNSGYVHSTILEDKRVLTKLEDFLASVPNPSDDPVIEEEFDKDLIISVDSSALDIALNDQHGELTGRSESLGSEVGVGLIQTMPGTTYRNFGGRTEIIINNYREKTGSYQLNLLGKDFGDVQIKIGEVVYPVIPATPDSYGVVDLNSITAPDVLYYPVGTSSASYSISPETNDSVLGDIDDLVSSYAKTEYCIQRKTGEVVPRAGYLH